MPLPLPLPLPCPGSLLQPVSQHASSWTNEAQDVVMDLTRSGRIMEINTRSRHLERGRRWLSLSLLLLLLGRQRSEMGTGTAQHRGWVTEAGEIQNYGGPAHLKGGGGHTQSSDLIGKRAVGRAARARRAGAREREREEQDRREEEKERGQM